MADERENVTGSASPRRPRSELRELMLQAGYEVLLRDGLGLGTDALTYKTVFDHLEATQGIRVTRGSVHERIWDSQRDFQLDVLTRAVQSDTIYSIGQTTAAISDILANADLSTQESRAAALKEAIRIGARTNLEAAESDDLWKLREGVAAIISVQRGDPTQVEPIQNEVRASYEATTDTLVAFYNSMMEAFGGRVRPDLGLTRDVAVRMYAMVVTALSEGSSLRRRHDTGYAAEFDLPTGLGGEREKWDLFSLGFWALTQFFFEDDDLDQRTSHVGE